MREHRKNVAYPIRGEESEVKLHMKMDFNWEGLETVRNELLSVSHVSLTIDRQLRLSPAAFRALDEPEYVHLLYDAAARLLTVRKASAEEAASAKADDTDMPLECCGVVRTAHVIGGVKPFRRMLLQELNGQYRYRLLGNQNGAALEFSLKDAVLFKPSMSRAPSMA